MNWNVVIVAPDCSYFSLPNVFYKKETSDTELHISLAVGLLLLNSIISRYFYVIFKILTTFTAQFLSAFSQVQVQEGNEQLQKKLLSWQPSN